MCSQEPLSCPQFDSSPRHSGPFRVLSCSHPLSYLQNGVFLPKSSNTSKAPILRSFYCQFLPFCSLSTGLFSDSSPKPLPSVFISIIMNSTHFCITPMNIFHGFPADLHWPCYHSALGAELQDCKTFGLVPEGAWEAGGDRGHDVHPTSPGREITPAPTDPTLPPCSCQVQFQQLSLLQIRRKFEQFCKNSQ